MGAGQRQKAVGPLTVWRAGDCRFQTAAPLPHVAGAEFQRGAPSARVMETILWPLTLAELPGAEQEGTLDGRVEEGREGFPKNFKWWCSIVF